jgi:hypothetical protein
MRLARHQPYFFPYIGYFSLISECDMFVLFDTSQYVRHSWMNRNRIAGLSDGWEYITVPVRKHDRATPTRDVRISDQYDWRGVVKRQLERYRRHAPHYRETIDLVSSVLAEGSDRLARLNTRGVVAVCEYLAWIIRETKKGSALRRSDR